MKKITAAVNKMIDDITVVPKIYQIFSIFPPQVVPGGYLHAAVRGKTAVYGDYCARYKAACAIVRKPKERAD